VLDNFYQEAFIVKTVSPGIKIESNSYLVHIEIALGEIKYSCLFQQVLAIKIERKKTFLHLLVSVDVLLSLPMQVML
jgi:hypothetical protein